MTPIVLVLRLANHASGPSRGFRSPAGLIGRGTGKHNGSMANNGAIRPANLAEQIGRTTLAFRGYNITNIGRSRELLLHPEYGPVVKDHLVEAGKICAEITGRKVDLVARVRQRREPSLRCYAEAIALIMAMELAQLRVVEEIHNVPIRDAQMAFGYSLGELSAVAYGRLFRMRDVLEVPLTMAQDSAKLAHDVTMGVLFSRGPAIVESQVQRLCFEINARGKGVIGISSVLSPNTLLLLGQRRTVHRFKRTMPKVLDPNIHLRINPNRWPPLHMPIMWQRAVPNRAAVMMQRMRSLGEVPQPPVLSLVTGTTRYTDLNARDLLHRWIDHPQRLWDAVYETLSLGTQLVIHVGPEPNLVPATFKRLSENVRQQTTGRSLGSLGMRAVSGLARRPWLASLLPSRTSLLRAPDVRHVVLEDWLLDQTC